MLLYVFEVFLGVLLFMGGACIFSFLNVVIYRVPRHISFIKGRSMCTDCSHVLGALDMVPILSWLFLGHKCRYCGAPVSGRYAFVEGIGGCLALITIARYGLSMEALFQFVFFCLLTVVAFVDWDTMEIPNGFVVAVLLLAVFHLPLTGSFPWSDALIGFVIVSVPLYLITVVIPGAFGGGDIKLMAVCGMFMGFQVTLISFFFAVLGGGFYGIYLLASHRKGKKEHFAFGPFLCVGMLVGELWGLQVFTWYLGLFGIAG